MLPVANMATARNICPLVSPMFEKGEKNQPSMEITIVVSLGFSCGHVPPCQTVVWIWLSNLLICIWFSREESIVYLWSLQICLKIFSSFFTFLRSSSGWSEFEEGVLLTREQVHSYLGFFLLIWPTVAPLLDFKGYLKSLYHDDNVKKKLLPYKPSLNLAKVFFRDFFRDFYRDSYILWYHISIILTLFSPHGFLFMVLFSVFYVSSVFLVCILVSMTMMHNCRFNWFLLPSDTTNGFDW